jgi:hypothetical protein
MFLDECSVERGACHMRKYVFRSAGQQYNRDKVTAFNKSKDIRVMVWAAVYNSGYSDLCIIRRDPRAPKKGYTANSYIRILRDGLLPILETDSVLQQDGAGIHRAKAIMKFSKDKGVK